MLNYVDFEQARINILNYFSDVMLNKAEADGEYNWSFIIAAFHIAIDDMIMAAAQRRLQLNRKSSLPHSNQVFPRKRVNARTRAQTVDICLI